MTSFTILTIFYSVLFTVILGDFNEDPLSEGLMTKLEGTSLEALTSFQLLKSESAHNLLNTNSSIDFVFTDQPNLVADCSIHPTLHPVIINCSLHSQPQY